ncbi:NAD(P)H-hydrate dehydratase [Flagellimonas sp. 2504JD4-2]
MKIFTAEQIYQADKFTIAKQQIASDELMERAALKLFEWMHSRLQGAQVTIHLFCGIGNNGGDGIALARHLHEHGYNIKVHVVNYSEKRSKDFLLNLERLKDRKIWPEFINEETSPPEITPNDIIVDAIFGIGLNRKPDEWVGKIIKHINASRAFVLSVDIPSGLPMDRMPWNMAHVVEASYVLSFQAPKLVFFLPQTGVFINQWEILDIGLDAEFMSTTESPYELVGKSAVLRMYRPRLKFSHKGTYGHSVIVGGSYGKIGAVQLACKACLLAGSGLVTAYVPECGYHSLQTAAPELMVLTDEEDEQITQIDIPFTPSTIGIGMGMGTAAETVKAFGELLKKTTAPMVIDADGLNMLAKNPKLLKDVPERSVLTPHPKELERLLGKWEDDFEKLEKAKRFTSEYGCILLIKGAHTMIVEGNKIYINSTGNPGLATAGSGDVLMGLITGLIAQGYEPLQGAIFGVYLHGLAGDIKASKIGYEALIASGIIDNIGMAYMELLRPPERTEVNNGEA